MAALASSAVLLAALHAHVGDDMSTARQRAREIFAWPVASALNSTAASARGFAATLNASCYWSDINYADQSRAVWQTIVHLDRVQTMVQAITAPGSPAWEDPSVSSAAHCALGSWIFRAQPFTNPNWWYHWIGEELLLQSVYLMLGSNRTTAQEQSALVRFSYNSAWWVNDYGGGDNLSDMLRVQIMRGLASSNSSAVDQAFDVLWGNVQQGNVTENWQGIVNDFSYHFHGQQILSGSYGEGWLSTMLSFYLVASGTQWDMPVGAQALLARFIVEGDLLLTFGSAYDFGVAGRGIDRPGSTFQWAVPADGVRTLAASNATRQWSAQLLGFADLVDGGHSSPPGTLPVTGAKYFWTSDYLAVHRATWGASLKMHGNNGLWTVTGNECDNLELAPVGEHTGSGVLNVYHSSETDVAAQAYVNIFPLLDWRALNGITVEHDTPLEYCGTGSGDVWPVIDTAFVGAVTDGMSAVAAMDTATHNLTGRRAWFFFDSVILALAANLTDPAPANVRTSLASRLIPTAAADPLRGSVTLGFSNGSATVLPDGNYTFPSTSGMWLNAGGIGMVPFAANSSSHPGASPSSFGVSAGVKEGSWSSIGPNSGTVSGRYLSAYLDHGVHLTGATYAYLLAPNTTAADMPAIAAADGGVACVVNTPELQAAAAQVDGSSTPLLAMVVWDEGGASYSCAGISATTSRDGMLLLSVDPTAGSGAGTVTITAAHPALSAAGSNMTVAFNRVATGPGCMPSAAAGSTSVSLLLPRGDLLGSPVTVTCALQG